jgi:uncharacterized protein DUF6477
MQLQDVLFDLSRPKILLSAAKICLKTYSRDKDLRRIIGSFTLTKPDQNLQQLTLQEGDLEKARICGSATYDMKLHITIMTALLQELYLLSEEPHKP